MIIKNHPTTRTLIITEEDIFPESNKYIYMPPMEELVEPVTKLYNAILVNLENEEMHSKISVQYNCNPKILYHNDREVSLCEIFKESSNKHEYKMKHSFDSESHSLKMTNSFSLNALIGLFIFNIYTKQFASFQEKKDDLL